MKNYIDYAISRSRTTLSIFAAIIIAGLVAYRSIPVELNPDVEVPIIVTTILHDGISPEDAERLLAKPAELELKTLDGITQIDSFSSENAATVIVEFDIDFEPSTALADVREAMNRAKARFPQNRRAHHPGSLCRHSAGGADCHCRRRSTGTHPVENRRGFAAGD